MFSRHLTHAQIHQCKSNRELIGSRPCHFQSMLPCGRLRCENTSQKSAVSSFYWPQKERPRP